MQINNRKLLSDLGKKDDELKAIRSDFDKVIGENMRYKAKLSEEKSNFAELKKVQKQIQVEQ